MALYKIFLRIY